MMKTQQEINNLPTIMDLLNNIAKGEQEIRNDSNIGFFFNQNDWDDKFEITQLEKDGAYVLIPTNSHLRTYYRGQRKYYPECKPTIYRNIDKRSEVEIFIERVRTIDFELLLGTHPFVRKMYCWDLSLTLDLVGDVDVSMSIDTQALAQHYNLQTDLIDVTFDKWVAAFFAVTEYVKNRYVPVESGGYGVLYSFWDPLASISGIEGMSKYKNSFSAIALQPFPRPAAQRAATIKLNKGEDFNNYRGVEKHFFKHDKLASQLIFNKMNQGKDLFPEDELEECSKKVKASKKLSISAFDLAFKQYPIEGIAYEELKAKCTEKGIKLVNHQVFKFPKDIEKKFLRYWEKKGEEEFLSKIVYRFAYYGDLKLVDGKDII